MIGNVPYKRALEGVIANYQRKNELGPDRSWFAILEKLRAEYVRVNAHKKTSGVEAFPEEPSGSAVEREKAIRGSNRACQVAETAFKGYILFM